VPVLGESGEKIDTGDIELKPNIEAYVELESAGDESPGSDDPLRTSVVVTGSSEAGPWGPRIVAQRRGNRWVLTQVPIAEGEWEVTRYVRNGERLSSEIYSGKAVFGAGRPNAFRLRLLRDSLRPFGNSMSQGRLEVQSMPAPTTEPKGGMRWRGRLIAPDGSAIAGAVIGGPRLPIDRSEPVWAFTGRDGSFDVRVPDGDCRNASFALGRAQPEIVELYRWQDEDPKKCEAAWKDPVEVSLPVMRPFVLMAAGRALEPMPGQRLYWWHGSLGWQQFMNPVRNWIPLSWTTALRFKLESPGRMPRLIPVTAPYYHPNRKETALPEQIEIPVEPDDTGGREMIVTSAGRPVADVLVDLEAIDSLASDHRMPLAVYRTGKDGRLVLAGEGKQLVEAFLYRDGYEPARAIWESGRPLRVDLQKRAAVVVFEGLVAGQVVRIRRVGEPQSVRTLRFQEGAPKPEVRLVPGQYDTIVYSDRGQVVKSQRTAVAAGRRVVDASADGPDQRPVLVVRFPGEGWRAGISDSALGGMAVGWAAYSIGGRSFRVVDVAAEAEKDGTREQTFRLSRPGRFHVSARHKGRALTLWREMEMPAGAVVTVEVPDGDAVLGGSMRTYDGGIGFMHHGWAGPRLQLISEDPDGWSITDYLPKRDGDGASTFTIRSLPAGKYFVNQHLIGETKSFRFDDGTEQKFNVARNAWGGIPVVLRSGETTTLKDFDEYPYGEVAIEARNALGEPLAGATIRVRDRMSESWRVVEEGPGTMSSAANPIPYPPAARVINGKATLPGLRAGRLEFSIELDEGPIYRFRAAVDPKVGITVQLPE
jgi:hypothetical protein